MTCLVGHDHIGVVDVRAEDRLSHRIKIVAHMLVVIYDLHCYAASPPPPCISEDNELALLKSIHPRSQLYSESNCVFEVSEGDIKQCLQQCNLQNVLDCRPCIVKEDR